jgi:RimJ/RimL family protein N-acetyltransferase
MIHGKQVRVRNMEASDLADVQAINDDPVVRGNVVGWAWPNSLADQERWFDGLRPGATHRWVVVDHDDRVIGVTGLWDVDPHDRNALTALKIGGQHGQRGRGVGADAIKTVMAFAFHDVGLERLYSSILAFNEASLRAYTEKCGWTIEGTSRRHVWRHGQFHDLYQVGILRKEWEALPDSGEYVDLIRAGR